MPKALDAVTTRDEADLPADRGPCGDDARHVAGPAPGAGHKPELTVIVTACAAVRRLGQMLADLADALSGLQAEIVLVPGADTPASAADLVPRTCPVPVRALRRPADARVGLSDSVMAGARAARGEWVLAMAANRGHPPAVAARVADAAMRHDCDVVVGSRRSARHARNDRSSRVRRARFSAWATRLVKSLFPRRLAMVSDPLSDLFAFRRDAIALDRLRPRGFTVLLEILVRNPHARVAEVAYTPSNGLAQDTAISLRDGFELLRHVGRLRVSRLAAQLRKGPATYREHLHEALRFVAFGTVGASGILVNTAALWFFYVALGWNHILGAALATQASTTWNFLLIDLLVYRRRASGSRLGRAVRFFAMNNLLLAGRLPVFQFLVVHGVRVLLANALTLVLLFLVRFLVSDRAIFAPAPANGRDPVRLLVDLCGPDPAAVGRHCSGTPKRSRYLPFRYDIAGIVTVGTQVVLPELEFFRAQWISDADVDIAVRVGDVGSWLPRRRAGMTESGAPSLVRYEEHLGRLGANFLASIDDSIAVEVGPLLARSPHVVYTNIVEPLLRFALVSRGRMLLHSACVEMGGVGVMLSARTDTGKTGTVLRLLRERGARFLSDDMTIIGPDGWACCFPKPLTISAHTVRAVRAHDLTRAEWRSLRVQSRLHSRSGRSIGMMLSRFNLPIMAINAVTQILIPPPKYTADRIVPCRLAQRTLVRDLFIIERGRPSLVDLDHATALARLIVNTDDAYGFPPYRYLAPALSIGGRNYGQLRDAEREILSAFLERVRVRVLTSDTFGWADEIPGLVDPGAQQPGQLSSAGNGRKPTGDTWPRWNSAVAWEGM